jgi:hypothetical protein
MAMWCRSRPRSEAGARSEGPVIRVLFVCTGNICRSPTGEAVLRQQVASGAGAIASRSIPPGWPITTWASRRTTVRRPMPRAVVWT